MTSTPDNSLDGTWQLLRAEWEGETAHELVTQNTVMELKAGAYVIRFGGETTDEGSFELGNAKSGTTITLYGMAGTNAGRTVPGIYQRIGERLRICFGLDGQIPTDFSSRAGQPNYFAIYQRRNGAPPLVKLLVLFTSLLLIAVGLLALAANTKRVTNQLLFILFSCVGASYFCVYGAIRAGEIFAESGISNPVPWLRTNAVLACAIPALLVMSRDSIRLHLLSRRSLLRRCAPWLAFSVIASTIALTDAFIPEDSTHFNRKRGVGYFAITGTLSTLFSIFIIQTWSQINKTSGIRRLELQLLVFNLAVGLSLFVLFSLLGNLFFIHTFKGIAFVITSGTAALTWFSICYYRVFDLKDILLALAQRALTASLCLISGIMLLHMLRPQIPETAALLVILGTIGITAPWLDKKARNLLGIGNESRLIQMRRTVIDSARAEPNYEKLTTLFERLLRDQYATTFACLATELREDFCATRFTLSKERLAYDALRSLGWATVDSLQRRRSSAATNDLRALLVESSIHLIVAVPKGSPTPALLVAIGQKADEKPYTYPDVEFIQNVAELMDNILTHSRVSAQAALQAKIEHLAMMSRGLAHDLKNLITPVSSFLIHMDGKYPPDTAEGEVHASARLSVKVMTEYVREVLFFSERLQPKLETVNLAKLLDAVVEISRARAGAREVSVLSQCTVKESFVADGVLLQRLLVNLVSNAIDASAPGMAVKLAARMEDSRSLILTVKDDGSGIAKEDLTKIFEPYFTTKRFGSDIRGFGLGLTICQKITNLHGGIISVQSERGKGTSVKVELPTVAETRRMLPTPPCLALP